MKDELDLRVLDEIPDPLAGLGELPPPRACAAPAKRPATRAQVGTMRTVALVGAFVYEAALLAVMNKRDDLRELPRSTLALELAIPMAAASVAFLAAASPGNQGVGEPKARLVGLALLAPLFFALATLFGGVSDMDTESFVWHAARCFLWTGIFAVGPMLLAVWAFRRAFVAAPAWRTAALGIACAALGAASMSVTCSIGSPAHVLLGHGGMMLVAGVSGALVGRKLGEA